MVKRSFSAQNIIFKLMKPSKYTKEDKELENFNAIRVFSICIIVLGNTYLSLFRGPVRNLEVKEEWISTQFFSVVLLADLQSDIFFFITAFTWGF